MQRYFEVILGETNKNYYERRFEEFDKHGPGFKPSWNWIAFLFGVPWTLYRKMYGWFFILLGTRVICEYLNYVEEPVASWVIRLIIMVVFALFADYLYQENLRKKIESAKLKIEDEQELTEYLGNKGGVNQWVVWASIAACLMFPIIMMLLPFIIIWLIFI